MASDGHSALAKIQASPPDLVTLDVEMPRQDGISFLRELMAEHPLPVLMCSTLTGKGTETQLQALAAGAVGCITKPRIGLKQFFESDGRQVVEAIQQAALARPRAQRMAGPALVAQMLEKVRQQGYATNDGEWFEQGKISAIALPITHHEQVLGSINVVFLRKAMTLAEGAARYLPDLQAAVGRIEARLSQMAQLT